MKKIYNIIETKRIIEKYNFSFSKRYGQNFLIDGNILNSILKGSHISKDDNVLEIGTGIGTLTQMLCEKSRNVVSFEIDESLKEVHKETLNYENLKIIYEDFMTCDIDNILKEYFNGKKVKVIANIPYYITTPIITKLFEYKKNIQSITVMIQKEVAQRLTSGAGEKNYGSISAFVQYHSIPKIISTVSRNVFFPKPKVDSAIVYLDILEKSPLTILDEEIFFKIIKGAFGQRRKTFINSVSGTYNEFNKELIRSTLIFLGFNENIRGEKLSVKNFADISNYIYENLN